MSFLSRVTVSFLLILFYSSVFSKNLLNHPEKIFISFPKEIPVNKEIEVKISISNLKKANYDLKILIEKDGETLSEVFNEKENKWQSSNYYLKNFFSEGVFERNLKMRIREEKFNFRGEADLVVRLRETGKKNFLEKREKIELFEPEIKKISPLLLEDNLKDEKLKIKNFLFVFSIALFSSLLFGTGTFFLAKRDFIKKLFKDKKF